VAGVAAALEASREGARVILLEKTLLPGGLATSGLINVYLPLCDGNGHQVTFGLAEELLRLSMRYGPGDIPDWRAARNGGGNARFRVVFSPAAFVLALDEALQDAGVELWLDTLVCAAIVEKASESGARRVAGIEAETKGGRLRFLAHTVIDATGDADVAHRAGVLCHDEANSLACWALDANVLADAPTTLQTRGGRIGMLRVGGHRAEVGAPAPWHGLEAPEITRFALEGRAQVRRYYREAHAAAGPEARQTHFPIALPVMAQFRTTRRIEGRERMRPGEMECRRETSVGLAPDWRKPGCVWETPWGALLPAGIGNLLVAGRCIAAEGDAWDVMRVIPAAAMTGQVCGLAAALAARGGSSPEDLAVTEIQTRLRAKGFLLHRDEVVR